MDFVIFGSKEKVSRNGVPLQKTSSIYYIYIIYIYIVSQKNSKSKTAESAKKKGASNPLHQRTDEEDFALFSFPLALLPSFPFLFTEGRKNDRASRSLARSLEGGGQMPTLLPRFCALLEATDPVLTGEMTV